MNTDLLQIDTKGCCLLCFKDCPSTVSFGGGRNDSSRVSFKLLLRYLKVNVLKLSNFTSSILEGGGENSYEDGVEVGIQMCEECFKVVDQFHRLYEEFERIRLQMDLCVQSIHNSMVIAEADGELLAKYKEKMRSRNPWVLFNASLAENLRRETLNKCFLKTKGFVPRVTLQKKNNGLRGSNHECVAEEVVEESQTVTRSPQRKRNRSCRSGVSDENMASTSTAMVVQNREDLQERHMSESDSGEGIEVGEDIVVKMEPDMLNLSNSTTSDNEMNQSVPAILKVSSLNSNPPPAPLPTKKSAATRAPEKCEYYFCDVCYKDFPTITGLHIHARTHRPKSPPPNRTRESFRILSLRKNQRKPVNVSGNGLKKPIGSSKWFQCYVCKLEYPSEEILTEHIHMSHARRGTSTSVKNNGNQSTQKTYTQKKKTSRLGSMIYNEHREQPNTCGYCSKRTGKGALRSHIVSKHPLEAFSKKLPEGTDKGLLDRVIAFFLDGQQRYPEEDFECPCCPKRFKFSYPLRKHILQRHIDKVSLRILGKLPGESIRSAMIHLRKVEMSEESEGQQVGNEI